MESKQGSDAILYSRELSDAITSSLKNWNKLKQGVASIAVILFVVALLLFCATPVSSYTLPHIIVMAVFAAPAILAPFILLPWKTSQRSLLDYICFNSLEYNILSCIEDIQALRFQQRDIHTLASFSPGNKITGFMATKFRVNGVNATATQLELYQAVEHNMNYTL